MDHVCVGDVKCDQNKYKGDTRPLLDSILRLNGILKGNRKIDGKCLEPRLGAVIFNHHLCYVRGTKLRPFLITISDDTWHQIKTFLGFNRKHTAIL